MSISYFPEKELLEIVRFFFFFFHFKILIHTAKVAKQLQFMYYSLHGMTAQNEEPNIYCLFLWILSNLLLRLKDAMQ